MPEELAQQLPVLKELLAQLGFVITSVIGLFLNWGIMWALTALFGENEVLLTLLGFSLQVWMVNKVVATGLVMVWNYFTKRYVLQTKE